MNNYPFSPSCLQLIFNGEYVRTDEKAYHAQHFVCHLCECSLTGEQHLVDDGLPICIACYDDKYASVCHKCNKSIGKFFLHILEYNV